MSLESKSPVHTLPTLLGSNRRRSSSKKRSSKLSAVAKQAEEAQNTASQSKAHSFKLTREAQPKHKKELRVVPCPKSLALPPLTTRDISWKSADWLAFEQEVKNSCSWKSVRKLMECIHNNSALVLQHRRYKTEENTIVDLSKHLRPFACAYWFGRDNVVVPSDLCFSNTQFGGAQSPMSIAPPLIVMTASPLEAVTRLASAGLCENRSTKVMIEVSHFQKDGQLSTCPVPGMPCTQQEMLLCTDFAKFAAAAAGGYLQNATCTLKTHLTAVDDPYVFLCPDMTVFRGARGDGYALLSKPVCMSGICTGQSSARPMVSTGCAADKLAARQTEWYSCEDDQLALLERLNLIGLTALQDVGEENNSPKILVLSMLGYCGRGALHPRDAVANSLKQWRFRFARFFHAVVIACGPDEEVAKLFDAVINQDVYEADPNDMTSGLDSWHWDDRFWPMHVNSLDLMLVAAACQASRAKKISSRENGTARTGRSRRASIQSMGVQSEMSISFCPNTAVDKESRRNSASDDSRSPSSIYRRLSIESVGQSSGIGRLSALTHKCQSIVDRCDQGGCLWRKPLNGGRRGAVSARRLIDAKSSSFIVTCQDAMNMRQSESNRSGSKPWFQGTESRRASAMLSRRSSIISGVLQSRRGSKDKARTGSITSRRSSCTPDSSQNSRRTSCVIKESSQELEALVHELEKTSAPKLPETKEDASKEIRFVRTHRVETALTGEASQDEWSLRDECTMLALRLQEHWLNSKSQHDGCHIGLSPFYLAWRVESGQVEGQAFANLEVAERGFVAKRSSGFETMLFTDEFEEVYSFGVDTENVPEFKAWWKLQAGCPESSTESSSDESEDDLRDTTTRDEAIEEAAEPSMSGPAPSSPAWQKSTVKQAFLKLKAMAFLKIATGKSMSGEDKGGQAPTSPNQSNESRHACESTSEISSSCAQPESSKNKAKASRHHPTIEIPEGDFKTSDSCHQPVHSQKSSGSSLDQASLEIMPKENQAQQPLSPHRRMPRRVRRNCTQKQLGSPTTAEEAFPEVFEDIEDICLSPRTW